MCKCPDILDEVFNVLCAFQERNSAKNSRTCDRKQPQQDFLKHTQKQLKKSGLLVMTAGIEKSRTASYFLIKDMKYQFLCIVHRHMLINQATNCFYRFAGLLKLENPEIRNYKISRISSKHRSIKSVLQREYLQSLFSLFSCNFKAADKHSHSSFEQSIGDTAGIKAFATARSAVK